MENEVMKKIYALDDALTFERRKKHQLLELGKENILDISDDILKTILTPEEIEKYKKLRTINIEEKWNDLEKRGINFTYFGDSNYPKKLLNIPDPPFALYYKGELPKEDSCSVGIIGARQNSEYGSFMAKTFSNVLAKNNINIISGMALGIDGISQREALIAGGKSYGVLGCGVDVVYPQSNRTLYNDLQTHGGVISEYPPTVEPIARLFPPRNRIISGLSDCILVVEARQKSGTLITVDMALEQGKDVFAIPGRCTDSLSYGCNTLIRNGAICVCRPEELLEDMGWFSENTKKEDSIKVNISKPAKDILKVLDFNPKTLDDILSEIRKKDNNFSVTELSKGLLELEINNLIGRNFGQYSVKNRKI